MSDQSFEVLADQDKEEQRASQQTFTDVRDGVLWDPKNFKVPHLPYTIKVMSPEGGSCLDKPAEIPNQKYLSQKERVFARKHFTADGLYIEDMPVKTPYGEILIPDTVGTGVFKRILATCLGFELRFNPHLEEQYFYLTIQQSYVTEGKVQRIPGVHLDGFQKVSIAPQPAQHQLAITNVIPTQFVMHDFDISTFPEDKHGLFQELERQSVGLVRFEPRPYTIHLLNAFCPHEPGIATEDCFRTFIRFSASTIPFMRAGNTKNPLIDLEWGEKEKKKFYASIST